MTSCWISVESTSMTISRMARRCRPARCTATSTPLSAATLASAVAQRPRLGPGDVQLDAGHRVARQAGDPVDVGAAGGDPAGHRGHALRQQRAAEHGDVQPAVEAGRARRLRRPGGDLRLQAQLVGEREDRGVDLGEVRRRPSQASSTPRTRRPLIVTCSMSATLSGKPARVPKSREVTPGRSRPVSVIRSVVRGRFISPSRYRLPRRQCDEPRPLHPGSFDADAAPAGLGSVSVAVRPGGSWRPA